MPAKPTTVAEFLSALPPDRRAAIDAVRAAIRRNLDPQIEEGVQYGMIGYFIPHKVYPAGYHCDPKQPLPVAGLGAQKSHMALYMSCLYMSPDADKRFRDRWTASGKKLDMGKGCVRFKSLADVPLDVIEQTFRDLKAADHIATYERALAQRPAAKKSPARATAKKVAKKAAAKPATKIAGRATSSPAKPAKKVAKRARK